MLLLSREREQQKGYAHFVEHMAFNGSKNFSGNDVVALFEQSALGFGADLNAYTLIKKPSMLDLPDKESIKRWHGL